MSCIRQFFDQQYGSSRWKLYEDVIKRFRCMKDDQFTQLVPNEDAYCDTPIFSCKFAEQDPYRDLIAIANEDGKLAIHDTSNKEERVGTQAHNNAIFDLAWMFESMKIVTASGDHTARLFDVSNRDITEVKAFYGHSRSVKTVTFRKNDPSVFATGGRDGNIIVWDTRTDVGSFVGRADRTITNSHVVSTSTPSKSSRRTKSLTATPTKGALSVKSVTGLVFQDSDTLISCGAGDGVIKVWDLRKSYVTYKQASVAKVSIPYGGFTNKNGFSSLLVDKQSLRLYANCLDNTIYCYNLNTYSAEPIMKYVGHQNSTFYIKSCLSRSGDFLVSGSSDEKAYIWNIKKKQPIVILKGHTAEVTCVAWSEVNDFTLVTCSDDMTHRIWRIGTESLPENWEITGRGQAELYPITEKTQQKPKRVFENLDNYMETKKLALLCEACNTKLSVPVDTTSSSTEIICEACRSLKRKIHALEEDDCYADLINTKRIRLGKNIKDLSQKENDTHSEELASVLVLPNFVVDGVAPHINYSPPKKKQCDWLTSLRIKRQLLRSNDFCEEMPSVKIPKLELSEHDRMASHKKVDGKTQSPLLRYFKIKCEGHGSKSMGTGVCLSSPNPKLTQ